MPLHQLRSCLLGAQRLGGFRPAVRQRALSRGVDDDFGDEGDDNQSFMRLVFGASRTWSAGVRDGTMEARALQQYLH